MDVTIDLSESDVEFRVVDLNPESITIYGGGLQLYLSHEQVSQLAKEISSWAPID